MMVVVFLGGVGGRGSHFADRFLVDHADVVGEDTVLLAVSENCDEFLSHLWTYYNY